MIYTVYVYPIALIVFLSFFFIRFYKEQQPIKGTSEWILANKKQRFAFPESFFPFEWKKDLLPMLSITVVYAAVTFFYLGDFSAPQSFASFEEGGVVFEMEEPGPVREFFYYTGLGHTGEEGYTLEFSHDGHYWRKQPSMTQQHSQTFRWLNAQLEDIVEYTRYIRITAPNSSLELGEIRIKLDDDSYLKPEDIIFHDDQSVKLFDEQDIIPERYDIMNSSHFDEIYHAYTAYEHTRLINPYERTHPPLGKLITSLGITLFGMTPFGWRFFPALFGVLMLPVLYLLLKNMFGKTIIAASGAIIFAADFMHFVQTRISTIDVYGVFFIICMYLFMYRFITSGMEASIKKVMPSLALCGLSFGLGIASKWIDFYAAPGLIVLYFLYLGMRKRHSRIKEKPFWDFFAKTAAWSVLWFVVVPFFIYLLSYYPYALSNPPQQADTGGLLALALPGAAEGVRIYDLFHQFWQNQSYMFNYHAGVDAQHTYSSRWYEWLFNYQPILYYANYLGDTKGTASAFTNPLVCWGGLLALISCFWIYAKKKILPALFVIIGYFSQLLPWVFVSRITFPYHYFPSIVFLVIALCLVMNMMLERKPERLKLVLAIPCISVLLFALFYPALSGFPAYNDYYSNVLRWLNNWGTAF